MDVLVRLLFCALASLVCVEASAAKLFYLEKSAKGCEAKTLELPQKTQASLFTTAECPTQIVWAGPYTYSVSENQLWEQPTGGKIKSLARLPWPIQNLWVDKTTQRPRIAYLVLVDDKNVVKKTVDGKQKTFFRFENQLFDATELVDFGTPHVAVVADLEGGKWKRLEAKATKSEAGDTPHLTVLDSYNNKQEMGSSLESLLNETTCTGGKLNCEVEDARIKKLAGKLEGYGSTSPTAKAQFVFNVVMGDSLHASSPVMFCKEKCVKVRELNEPQLAISANDGYVMIATEYTNEKARVYNETTGLKIADLPNAQSVVWWPNPSAPGQ